jgi:hypothetical protein
MTAPTNTTPDAEEPFKLAPFTTPDADLNALLDATAWLARGPNHNNMDTGIDWYESLQTVLARLTKPRAEAKPATSSLILNPAQAEAVYSAMCALNNISNYNAIQFTNFRGELIGVATKATGEVIVERGAPVPATRESYPTQAEFATAYGLNAGA